MKAIALCLLLKKTKLIRSNTTAIYCNSHCYIYMCATCFGLYLGHHQACLNTKICNESYNKNLRDPLFTLTIF